MGSMKEKMVEESTGERGAGGCDGCGGAGEKGAGGCAGCGGARGGGDGCTGRLSGWYVGWVTWSDWLIG